MYTIVRLCTRVPCLRRAEISIRHSLCLSPSCSSRQSHSLILETSVQARLSGQQAHQRYKCQPPCPAYCGCQGSKFRCPCLHGKALHHPNLLTASAHLTARKLRQPSPAASPLQSDHVCKCSRGFSEHWCVCHPTVTPQSPHPGTRPHIFLPKSCWFQGFQSRLRRPRQDPD